MNLNTERKTRQADYFRQGMRESQYSIEVSFPTSRQLQGGAPLRTPRACLGTGDDPDVHQLRVGPNIGSWRRNCMPNICSDTELKARLGALSRSPSGVSLSWPLALAGSARPSMTNISGSAACGGRKLRALRSCSCFERI